MRFDNNLKLERILHPDFSYAAFSRPSSSGCMFSDDWFFFLQIQLVNAVSPLPNASPSSMESGRALPKVSGRNSVRNPANTAIKENITKTDSRLYFPNSRPIIGANTAPTLAMEEQVPIPVFLTTVGKISAAWT